MVLLFAGWAALSPEPMAWIYIGVVATIELWLARRVKREDADPVAPGEPPYHFSDEEVSLVRRYRFYFTYPTLARDCSSILAAIGLSTLGLAPWLTYKRVLLPALLIGVNLFAVARFTKLVAPLMALRMGASRGDRAALRMLEVHETAWARIRAGNQAARKMQG
ncbi:MAG TPA: hypothetical protein VE325_03690 [Burkholderiales bacterium]|nr:hypothetical protein [Burkholderiales bacterium]